MAMNSVLLERWHSRESMNNPRNRCVPATKLFEDRNDSNVARMVVPFLR